MFFFPQVSTPKPKQNLRSIQWKVCRDFDVEKIKNSKSMLVFFCIMDITCFKTVIQRKANGHSKVKFWKVASYDPETSNSCITRFTVSFSFTNIKSKAKEVKFHTSSEDKKQNHSGSARLLIQPSKMLKVKIRSKCLYQIKITFKKKLRTE